MTKSPKRITSPLISRLGELDWDYAGDISQSSFSALHFHPGRFISQIPAALIGRLSRQGGTILDPYCGSGTTLLEAQRLGRASIGIDINPVSILVTKAKTSTRRAGRIANILEGHLEKMLSSRWEMGAKTASMSFAPPSSVQGEKWYHPATLGELTIIWRYIESTRGLSRDLLLFCFSAILMPACNETRHWGYICDNTRPLTTRRVDVFSAFETAAQRLIEAYAERDRNLTDNQIVPRADIRCGDAAAVLKTIADDTVDLVVTSPPYFGVVDYVKAQRLSMEWMGYDIARYRSAETGARSKRSRQSAHREYLDEVEAVFRETARVIHRGGHCCIIVGQSMKREDCLEDLERRICRSGLRLEFKERRSIAIGRRQTPSLKEEVLLVYVKN